MARYEVVGDDGHTYEIETDEPEQTAEQKMQADIDKYGAYSSTPANFQPLPESAYSAPSEELQKLQGSVLTKPDLNGQAAPDPFAEFATMIGTDGLSYGMGKGAALWAKKAADMAGIEGTLGKIIPEAAHLAGATLTDYDLSGKDRSLLGSAVNQGFNRAFGGIAESQLPQARTNSIIDKEFLSSDPAQRALRVASNENPEQLYYKDPSQITSLGPNTRQVIENVQTRANDGAKENLLRKLGASADRTDETLGKSLNAEDKVGAVLDDPKITNPDSISGLAEYSRSAANDIAEEQLSLVSSLSEQGVKIAPQKVTNALDQLEAKAQEWEKSSETKPFADSLREKVFNLKRDVNRKNIRGGVDPLDLLDIYRDLNFSRRTKGEFSPMSIAGAEKGSTGSMEDQVATRALSEVNRAIAGVFDSLSSPGVNPGEGAFSILSDKYGGYQAVADLADLQSRRLSRPLATRDPIMMSQGVANAPNPTALVNAPTNKSGFIQRGLEWLDQARDLPTAATRRNAALTGMDQSVARDIGDLNSLAQNPAILPDRNGFVGNTVNATYNNLLRPGIGIASYDALKSGGPAAVYGQSLNLPGQQDPYPAGLPRNTQTIDPEQFIPQFLERTGNNPIATGLAEKFTQAVAAGDRVKLEQLHEAMTMAFPQAFERGFGVNGRVYNVQEQQRYMTRLNQMVAEGKIKDPTILALQANNFNDPSNKLLIDISQYQEDPRQTLVRYNEAQKARFQSANGETTYSY